VKTAELKSVRFCIPCGDVLVRKPGERASQWKKRKSCCVTCSAKRRRQEAGAWRATAQKPCAACDVIMRPAHDEKKHGWRLRKYCGKYCNAYGAAGRKVANLPPEEQDTPGKRVRWLRVCESACGTKKPLAVQAVAALAGFSYPTWDRIEDGLPVLVADWVKRCAGALGVKTKVLTGPMDYWLRCVAGMTAKGDVRREEVAA
jgi:hypothetical protein